MYTPANDETTATGIMTNHASNVVALHRIGSAAGIYHQEYQTHHRTIASRARWDHWDKLSSRVRQPFGEPDLDPIGCWNDLVVSGITRICYSMALFFTKHINFHHPKKYIIMFASIHLWNQTIGFIY
jgi:hypothetical protein